MAQNALHVLPLAKARAQREADRRAAVSRQREQLIASIDRACEQSTLSFDDVQAALMIVQQRRTQRESEAYARKNWPRITGRHWGEI